MTLRIPSADSFGGFSGIRPQPPGIGHCVKKAGASGKSLAPAFVCAVRQMGSLYVRGQCSVILFSKSQIAHILLHKAFRWSYRIYYMRPAPLHPSNQDGVHASP